MIKISRVEAYQSFDENDFSVMDDETFLCFNSDQRKDRKQTEQFYMNERIIMLVIYWDGEEVHEISFENRLRLSKSGKERLARVRQVEEKAKNEELEKIEKRKTYLLEKKKQLIEITEIHRYYKRMARLMLYTKFLNERETEELLSVLKKNYKQKNNQLLKELEANEIYWIFNNSFKKKSNKKVNEFFRMKK